MAEIAKKLKFVVFGRRTRAYNIEYSERQMGGRRRLRRQLRRRRRRQICFQCQSCSGDSRFARIKFLLIFVSNKLIGPFGSKKEIELGLPMVAIINSLF